jgi:hypothetical protein
MTPLRHQFVMPLLLALILFLASCHAQPGSMTAASSADATPPALLGQWSGQHGGSDSASQLVVRDRESWEALWRQVGHDEPLTFDPSREMAVAIFAGARRTSGYGIEIVTARPDGENLVVEYREKSPAADQHVAQMLTAPWVIGVLPVSERQVVFRPIF